MTPYPERIIINGATSQYDRWLRALDPGYAEVDGRSTAELLNFAAEFGSLINFYNLHDEVDGDWVLFFLSDPAMILAAISSSDLLATKDEFARLEQLVKDTRPFDRQFEFLRETFQLILNLARRINRWLTELDVNGADEAARLCAQAITSEIELDLGAQLRLLKAYDEGAGLRDALGRPIGLNYDGFLSVWDLGYTVPDGSIYRGRTDSRKVVRALPHLVPIFDSFLSAISELQRLAIDILPGIFKQPDHKPQIALYIAFVELFRSAQDTINTFSSRYLDFYYREILREQNRGPVPDNVYLTFTLAEQDGVVSAPVAAGTTFLAGQDLNSQDILYASDKTLSVTGAKITNLQMLRVERDWLFDIEVVQRVFASVVDAAKATDAASPGEHTEWAIFGNTETGTSGIQITEPATFGFAIATPYLLLTGGTRIVTLKVVYTSKFKQYVLDPLLAALSAATGLSSDEILVQVIENAFTLYASTSAGWFEIEKYKVSLSSEPSFTLEFELPPTVPAISPIGPGIEDANPDPTQPTLKAYLQQLPVKLFGLINTVEVYPLSLLGEMEVTSFSVETEVSDLSEVQLENTDGPVDTSTPFYLLGAVPVLGSYVLIRHRELFVKTISRLQLAVSWFNLPQVEGGFAGYYKNYVIGPDGQRQANLFNNQSFVAGIDVQNPGHWTIEGACSPPSPLASPLQSDAYLFRTLPFCDDPIPSSDGALCNATSFDDIAVCPAVLPPYYDPSASALKLDLIAPSYAFGNSIYAQNVLNSVIEDLPDPNLCQSKCLAECRPLARAAECIKESLVCLSKCADVPDSVCIDACVTTCIECLLAQAAECLVGCLRALKGLPFEDAVGHVITRMRKSDRPPDVESTQWLKQYLEWLGERLPAPFKACIEKCLVIIEAILSVFLCSAAVVDPAVLTTCLKAVRKHLNAAHAACIERCTEDCMSLKKELKYPNEPYLPVVKSLTVNYRASCTIKNDNACAKVFHLLPFDGFEPVKFSADGSMSLLPRFDCAGSLYLGFSSLIPPQSLTMLFQLAAGGDDSESPPVTWEYLSENHWTPLSPSQLRADTTNGLQNTGVVTLALPAYDPDRNTLRPGNDQWLRASVKTQPTSFPKAAGLYPHVVLCTWLDNNNTGDNLRQPLPAHTINSAVEALPGIDKINQPIESFGGRPPETDRAFVIRVGERLRHKDRAILSWDYERLILERFPAVWQVQALPARKPQQGNSPGDVLVVVVPAPDNISRVDPTAPLAASNLLYQIKTYLEDRVSPFVQLHVVNPNYVRIGVSTFVQFRDDEDPGANIVRLNDELVKYLSPWFFDAARAERGARYASESDISEFIQTRPYVEAMDSISFRYEPEPQTLDWYFLTSAKQHSIKEV